MLAVHVCVADGPTDLQQCNSPLVEESDQSQHEDSCDTPPRVYNRTRAFSQVCGVSYVSVYFANAAIVMSLSTTTTTTYNLLKYSRSYPQVAANSGQSDQDWQHFVNPGLRLALDVKKSSAGELECFRMRILWSFIPGNDSMDLDQREVIFVGS
ncbi:hypothetical protein AcV7_004585 [Taiwanofungus camphoratus]|nr:hypothetical protein AcV7_004585 [Antrodia cinnamomea]